LPSGEALEYALKNYTGTVLFVSHDRYFVNSVASQIAELENGKITTYQGNYDDFACKKVKAETPTVAKQTAGNFRSAKQRAEQTNKARKLKELEQRITQLEKEAEVLNGELAKPEVAADYTKLSEVLQRLKDVERETEKLTAEWESLAE
ncbi:MAG: hypothetical protein ACI4QL_02475, partial [Candidatus Fimimonas sp.]